MVAFELVKNRKTKTPAKEETNALIKEAYKQGLILLPAGLYSNVVRLLVPLVIGEEQLQAGLDIIESSLSKIS